MRNNFLSGLVVVGLLVACGGGLSDVDELLVEACGVTKSEGNNGSESWTFATSNDVWNVTDSLASLTELRDGQEKLAEVASAAAQLDNTYLDFSKAFALKAGIVRQVVSQRRQIGKSDVYAILQYDWSFTDPYNNHNAIVKATCSGVARRLNS